MPRRLALLALLAFASAPITAHAQQPRVLVFSKTSGYRHSSIPNGIAAIRKLGRENGFAVDTTEDAGAFTQKNLSRYSAVVFMSTTGDVLNPAQQDVLERYIQAGGGYVGVHSATDTEYGHQCIAASFTDLVAENAARDTAGNCAKSAGFAFLLDGTDRYDPAAMATGGSDHASVRRRRRLGCTATESIDARCMTRR